MDQVLNYVGPQDLIRVAQTSKRMRDMVYDDTRWVQRLIRIGCWNEGEARRNAEQTHGLNGQVEVTIHRENPYNPPGSGVRPTSGAAKGPTEDGFDPVFPAGTEKRESLSNGRDPSLTILKSVRSIRGSARQEYGKVHAALNPFYKDIVEHGGSTESLVFKRYQDPEDQAQMLAQLLAFAKSDNTEGWSAREERLRETVSMFETAAVREFRDGYELENIDDQMRRYAHVLYTLNGGKTAVELFLHHNHIVTRKSDFGSVRDCIDPDSGRVKLEHTQAFLTRLGVACNEEASIIYRAFPAEIDVVSPFLEKIATDVLSPFLTSLFDELHRANIESYLQAVSGTFAQCLKFMLDLRPLRIKEEDLKEVVIRVLTQTYEPHLDLYLAEELDFFRKGCDATVEEWDRQLSEQAASAESFLMSNVNRQADKKDFLTSFKKVLMMPVTILPLPALGGKSSNDPRSSSPSPATITNNKTAARFSTVSPAPITLPEAPSDELAAKAAIMNTKLEGIRSLFSIEVALGLIHAARASLERVAQFVKLGGEWGEASKQQCTSIFVTLLHNLGHRHVIDGFDKAIKHLSEYLPQKRGDSNQSGLKPLVTFLELVNVADLILQMVDVFFEQELVGSNIVDRNDFLDPAVKGKKKFEQMLDGRVASGLNKGIDVLMEEVDYILATKQSNTDYNPQAEIDTTRQPSDVAVSEAAVAVVDVVSSHTKMLVGSTDKSTLDVFNQEVGLRLFASLCKHLKRQRISLEGSLKLIRYSHSISVLPTVSLTRTLTCAHHSDMNYYFRFIQTLRNNDLLLYFKALRELAQIYLVGSSDAKELAAIIADPDRFYGIFRVEEVYEFAQRRADWFQIRRDVERAMYGAGCTVM